LMVYMSDQLTEQLPGDLQARVEESLTVDEEEYTRSVYPDVRVVEETKAPASLPETMDTTVAIAEPRLIHVLDDPMTDRRLEIVDPGSGNRVITVIEVLSPGNKVGKSCREAYLDKQHEYRRGGVNLVEIDLIRTGRFVVAVPERAIAREYRTPYIICIRRASRPTVAEVVGVHLRDSLPNIRIPLRQTDADIVLQLQPLLDECYRRGRYDRLDYSQPLDSRLDLDDQEWANQLLKARR
ncbi:MAG: DUF4058 family protein, partial [Pirellulales bacterium]